MEEVNYVISNKICPLF